MAGFTLGALLFLAMTTASADDSGPEPRIAHRVEPVGEARVDWTALSLSVVGTGEGSGRATIAKARLQASHAARADAETRLLTSLGSLRLGRADGGASRLTDDAVRTRLKGLFPLCHTDRERFLADGAVRLTLTCPLGRGFSYALRHRTSRDAPDTPSSAFGSEVQTMGANHSSEEPPASSLILVVDEAVVPSLFPEVWTTSGGVVVDGRLAGPEASFQRGFVSFVSTEAQARSRPRAGPHPKVLKASGVDAAEPTRIIVEDTVAEAFRTYVHLLAQGRFIIASPRSSGELGGSEGSIEEGS
ncbi:MAG: hypothetical protein ACFB9M_07480 [Myxococcota bacterium]